MSVNLLSDDPRHLSIADDLESLLLVLIYYAVRYLSSSIKDNRHVADFLDECFDYYTLDNGKFLCGERKMGIVKERGELVHYLPGNGHIRVLFKSPLDSLLSTVLGWFRAHYKVQAWTAHVQLHPSLARAQEYFQTPAKSSRASAGNGASRYQSNHGAEEQLPPVPTPDERTLASRALVHSFIVDEFTAAAASALWSVTDRYPGGDRVPQGWVSKLDPVPDCLFDDTK